jgi:hypothetical protein
MEQSEMLDVPWGLQLGVASIILAAGMKADQLAFAASLVCLWLIPTLKTISWGVQSLVASPGPAIGGMLALLLVPLAAGFLTGVATESDDRPDKPRFASGSGAVLAGTAVIGVAISDFAPNMASSAMAALSSLMLVMVGLDLGDSARSRSAPSSAVASDAAIAVATTLLAAMVMQLRQLAIDRAVPDLLLDSMPAIRQ